MYRAKALVVPRVVLSAVVVATMALIAVGSAIGGGRPSAVPPDFVLVCHMVGQPGQVEVWVPAHSAVATKHVEEGNSILGPCPIDY